MTIPFWIENAFLKVSDILTGTIPRTVPEPARVAKARLVSHRGIYDNRDVYENTLPAFERVKSWGVWGVELDIRWTRDLHPVVFHDPGCLRLFGRDVMIRDMTLREVRARFPVIPSLAEVIDRYGRALHLMIELKEAFHAAEYQNQVLRELFGGLRPARDFHLLSLCPHIFNAVTGLPMETLVPIAETNVRMLVVLASEKGYGGVAGHYMLLRRPALRALCHRHLAVGTGYINSKYCFFREVNRGVTWHFSDRALALQKIRNRLISSGTEAR